MAVSGAAVLVPAALGCGEHVAQVLDRACAQQRFPVCAPGGGGKGGRNQDQVNWRKRAIELRKPQVVAHREPDLDAWACPGLEFESRKFAPGRNRARLVIGFLAAGKREEVDLVVTRDAVALRVIDQNAVLDPVRLLRVDRRGAADQPDAVFSSRGGKERLDRTLTIGLAGRDLVAVRATHDAEILRQNHESCAGACSARDQLRCVAQIGADVDLRDHLHGGDGDGSGGGTHLGCGACCCGFTLPPVLPLATRSRRLTTGSRQDPVTSYSKEKALDSGSRNSS